MTSQRLPKRDVSWIREALTFLEQGGSIGELVAVLSEPSSLSEGRR